MLVIGVWGSVDIIVNPYTQSHVGLTDITANRGVLLSEPAPEPQPPVAPAFGGAQPAALAAQEGPAETQTRAKELSGGPRLGKMKISNPFK